MANNIEFEGVISKGHFPPHIRQSIANVMNSMESKRIRVTIAEAKKQRSGKQNRFYWSQIVPAARNHFFDKGINLSLDETHEVIVKGIWKHTRYVTVGGEEVEIRRSSTDTDTKLWEQYADITRAYFAQEGLQLPLPNESFTIADMKILPV